MGLTIVVEPANAVTWVKGKAGLSCAVACAARDGCSEDAWPTSKAEFEEIAKSTGHVCEGTMEGGAKYDPSTDGHYCGWQGAEGDKERCAAAGDDSTFRFCPCNGDREL